MSTQIIVDEVVSRLHAVDGGSAMSPDAVRQLIDAVLPAVREMIEHERRVAGERAIDNGYADKLDGGAR